MKVMVEGHRYELDSFENGPPQVLQFIHKEIHNDGSLITSQDGTTNEEVLAVLINRLTYLNAMVGSRQTSLAITKLEEALMWLENRTADRIKREVEGTRLS